MLKKINQYFFRSPEEIGLVNYLVLVFCFITAIFGLIGTVINLGLHLGGLTIICTLSTTVIFGLMYLYSRNKEKYTVSKYFIIINGIILLNIQWFINYGSNGPILYLFVVVESFIIVFFAKKEKFAFSVLVFANVTVLFYIEYRFPESVGKYVKDSARLIDLYTGLLIYLFLSILMLNAALKFYIRQQQKAQLADKLKSAFLANMSHEIRTPMNGILGFAELLKEPNLSGQEQQEFVSIIEKSGKRMLSIINDIIDISKIESGLMKLDVKVSDINEQLDYIYNFFKPEIEKKGMHITVKKTLSSTEAIIKTDPEKLYAILINLVKNAIKYTDEGSIEVGYSRKSEKTSAELEFFVRDTGIGISEDRHEAIFERFVQADIIDKNAYQGAGLGLSIAKAYVEMLGGTIWVESAPHEGSSFYFTLPYNTDSIAVSPALNINPDVEDMARIKMLKIMIVEDDLASEMLIGREIKLLSREILKVNTGTAAVDACRKNSDIDLILMDIQIPEMDGYESTREIRKFNKNVVIIAQTAYALSGDRDKAIEAGCNDYIAKPIHTGALTLLIKQHFR